MSFCRWSSDGFQCDLYVYADTSGGYTTHVAARRHLTRCPELEFDGDDKVVDESFKAYSAWMDAEDKPMELIGLPHDGETFNDPDPASLLERVLMLRGLGYKVPEDAVDAIKAEVDESRSSVEPHEGTQLQV